MKEWNQHPQVFGIVPRAPWIKASTARGSIVSLQIANQVTEPMMFRLQPTHPLPVSMLTKKNAKEEICSVSAHSETGDLGSSRKAIDPSLPVISVLIRLGDEGTGV